MIKISPSVLACDLARLGQEAAEMEQAGADMLHLDVMDGRFVPNLTFGAPVISRLRRYTALPFDVHLMICEPLRYIADFAAAGAGIITFHAESDSDIAATIQEIRSRGVSPGLALKPATPAEAAFPFLEQLAMVLVMTVEPGFGGQSFMADMRPKISLLREECRRKGLAVDIQVDGGIDRSTAPLVVESGANILVAGSALFSADDYGTAVRALRESGDGRYSPSFSPSAPSSGSPSPK